MTENLNFKLGNYLLLILISPVLGIYYLFKIRNERLLVYAGTFLMGLLGSVYVYVDGGDGHTHRKHITNVYLTMDIETFFARAWEVLLLQAQTGVVDIYLHILSFISGSIFGVPELLHVFAGLVYGFIYFTGVVFLIRGINYQYAAFAVISLLGIFFMYRGVTGLNSVRWWTALWFLFTGCMGYLSTKKRIFILVAFLSILVHFSFIGLIIPIVLGWLLKKFRRTIFLLWFCSFFFAGSYAVIKPYFPDIGALNSREANLSFEPNTKKISQKSEDVRFYREWGETSFRNYSIVFLSCIIFFFYLRGSDDSWYWVLFGLGISLYTFGNLFEFSPAVSGRSKSGASVFILAGAIQFFGHLDRYLTLKSNRILLNYVVAVFVISAIPVILFHLSYIISMLSGFTLGFPVFSWLLGDEDLSIRDLIGIFF